MSDEIVTSVSESTGPSVAEVGVPKAVSNAKPYDDDLLDAYEKEATDEATSNGNNNKQESDKSVKDDTGEVSKDVPQNEDSESEEAKSTKNDKVEDGFEEVALKKFINGKEVEFKVKDAVQAYVKQEEFNRNMDKRITHVSQREQNLGKKEQAWSSEQKNFKDNVLKVLEIANQGDFVGAIRGLAKAAVGNSGLSVVELEKGYFSQLDKVREVYTKLSPAEQEAYWAKRAASDSKERADRLEEEKTVNSENSQLKAHIETLQEQYKIPAEEFWGNFKVLAENLVGPGKKYANPDEIVPEDVVRYSLAVLHETKVLEAAEKVGISDEEVLSELSKITVNHPEYTVDDIVTIIQSSGLATNASPEAVENLNRKAGKSNTRFNQASSTKKQNGTPEGYDTESIDFLYRNQPKAVRRIVR